MNSNDLRVLADWLDENPDRARLSVYASALLNTKTPDELAEAVRVIGGGDKETNGEFFSITKTIAGARIEAYIRHEAVCKRVQTGTRTVDRDVYPDDVQPTRVTVEEPVYEWVCPDSILKPSAA